jgi:hypothetical protein
MACAAGPSVRDRDVHAAGPRWPGPPSPAPPPHPRHRRARQGAGAEGACLGRDAVDGGPVAVAVDHHIRGRARRVRWPCRVLAGAGHRGRCGRSGAAGPARPEPAQADHADHLLDCRSTLSRQWYGEATVCMSCGTRFARVHRARLLRHAPTVVAKPRRWVEVVCKLVPGVVVGGLMARFLAPRHPSPNHFPSRRVARDSRAFAAVRSHYAIRTAIRPTHPTHQAVPEPPARCFSPCRVVLIRRRHLSVRGNGLAPFAMGADASCMSRSCAPGPAPADPDHSFDRPTGTWLARRFSAPITRPNPASLAGRASARVGRPAPRG